MRFLKSRNNRSASNGANRLGFFFKDRDKAMGEEIEPEMGFFSFFSSRGVRGGIKHGAGLNTGG